MCSSLQHARPCFHTQGIPTVFYFLITHDNGDNNGWLKSQENKNIPLLLPKFLLKGNTDKKGQYLMKDLCEFVTEMVENTWKTHKFPNAKSWSLCRKKLSHN
jgi:hypothetical protein